MRLNSYEKEEHKGFTLSIIQAFSVLFFLAMLAFAIVGPYFEAKTFNRFSDKKVGYWDAVFNDLRILPEDSQD